MSVVVPAHNEARSLPRLLSALLSGEGSGSGLEVLVVCNGCTDGTAEVARAHEDARLQVLEVPVASKMAALRAGVAEARGPWLALVDADVVISGGALASIASMVESRGALAGGPARGFDWTGVSWPVRWYYDVWQELPPVRAGLFGRGVLVLSPEGRQRLDLDADLLSDDLAVSEAFRPGERVVDEAARVTIRPPKTVPDLLRRRVRVAQGNTQADRAGVRTDAARVKPADLARVATSRPTWAAKVVVFLAFAVASRLQAKRRPARQGEVVWLRDESSRA